MRKDPFENPGEAFDKATRMARVDLARLEVAVARQKRTEGHISSLIAGMRVHHAERLVYESGEHLDMVADLQLLMSAE